MAKSWQRKAQSSEAFLIRKQPARESDFVAALLTKAHGVVILTARGGLKSRKRFGGVIQRHILFHAEWTETSAGNGFLTSAVILKSYLPVTGSIESCRAGNYLVELASSLFPNPEPRQVVFDVVNDLYLALSRNEISPEEAERTAEVALLSAGGWGPGFSGCHGCGRSEGGSYVFDPSLSVIFCSECRQGNGGPRVSYGTLRAVRHIQSDVLEGAGVMRVRLSHENIKELKPFLTAYAEHVAGRKFKSIA